MSKTILVTGGAGFIGRRVVLRLIAAGYRCVIVDNLFTGISPPITKNNPVFLDMDICSPELSKVFEKYNFDSVIHLAAVHHIPTCENNPILAFNSNILGTQNLLNMMSKYNVNRVFLASSGAVYDWVDNILDEEATKALPKDIYSISKLTNEHQVSVWNTNSRGIAVVGRIFNTIGHDDPNGHLIPDILRQIGPNSPEQTISLGNVEPRRDYIHADDTAEAIVRLHLKEFIVNQYNVVNICNGEEYSVKDIVECIGEVLKLQLNINIDKSKIRKFDRRSQLGSNAKLKKLIEWVTVPHDQSHA
jgi:UDP-glucose 4-epimerase